MTIGERIKERRESLGMSQVFLADSTNGLKQTIYKYETGVITNIPIEKIEQISKVLQTTPAYLMGWENDAGARDLGLTAIDVAKWIDAKPKDVDSVMKDMGWPDPSTPEIVARIAAEVQRRKPTPVSESGLDAEKLAFIEKLKSMDSATVSALNKLADSIIAQRGE